jgi:hypothetical protein
MDIGDPSLEAGQDGISPEVETLEAPVLEENENDAALIARFETDHDEVPASVDETLGRLNGLREYVHTTAMLRDEEDAVGTNFVLRTQYALLSILVPQDPTPVLRPRRQLAPVEAQGLPFTYEDAHARYAQTQEILIDFQQRQAGLPGIVHGAVQDALTTNVAWIKAIFQEDMRRDPLGYARQNDQVDLIARYEFLLQRRDEDSAELTPAEEAELARITPGAQQAALALLMADVQQNPPLPATTTLDPQTGMPIEGGGDPRIQAIAQLEQGVPEGETFVLPEIARYRGWVFQQVRPEDMRWDWNITRPEDLRYCRWMAHRVFMSIEEIRTKWKLTDEELRDAAQFDIDGRTMPSRNARTTQSAFTNLDSEDPEIDENRVRYAVWERWDIVSGKVYVWMQGSKQFLDCYHPKAAGRRFFPFFPFIFNRVSGKMIGPSDVELQMAIQDEINTLRTNDREARKSSHPRYIVAAGLLSPREKEKLESALPYAVVELQKANDVKAALHELVPNQYDPRLYDISKALIDLQAMAGLPMSALGATGIGELATEQAIARENMGVQTDYRKRIIESVIAEIYEYMAQVNAQTFMEMDVAMIVGAGAVWPLADRQQILNNFMVDVRATLNDSVERQKRMNDWQMIAGMAAQLGLPLNPIELTKELLELMQLRTNLERFVLDPMTLAAMRGQGIGPSGGGKAPQEGPGDQGDRGAEGGAPPMNERSGAPSPEQIPNGPAAGGA